MSEDRYTYSPTLRWNPQVQQYFLKAYSADHFARISKALTTPSTYSCIRVNFLSSTTDAVIRKLLSIMCDQNLQLQTPNPKPLHLQDALPPIASSQTPCIFKCQLPPLDYLLFIKGSGPHRLQYSDAPKEVIVSRKCAEAVLRGAQVFVPGVLACSSHVEKGDKVAVSVAVEQFKSDNEWTVGITRGTSLSGSHTDPHYIERKGLYIGQGTAMMSRAGIFRSHKGVAVELTSRVYQLPSFHDVLEGEIFLQNLPSIIVAHALDPQEGECILDMCAAPGGKTTAIAILMGNKGKVTATDRSHNKVMAIFNLASEMGLTCINAYRLDALKSVRKNNEVLSTCVSTTMDLNKEHLSYNSKFSKTECLTRDMPESTEICMPPLTLNTIENSGQATQNFSMSKLDISRNIEPRMNGPGRNNCIGNRARNSKGFLPQTFDRVLLDAPCSALGLRPRLFVGEETLESLLKHAKYQRKMFDQAVQLVRPGGVIVYSTCTINPGENEALVRYALDTYKFLSLAPQHPRIGGPGLVGHCELSDGKSIEKWLTPSESELVQRFDPCGSLDTIGFFIAKFNVGKKEN